jgi:hypothetical protein
MPTFELRGWYLSHRVKVADDVTTTVDLPARPRTNRPKASCTPA